MANTGRIHSGFPGAIGLPTATPEREEFLPFNRQSDWAEFNEVAVFAENASF